MLARGWLAYPVASMHAQLPPKSGCICKHIPRFALSRRRATALFRNPVCKAQRSVPGFSSTPTSACRRYATSPPSAVAYIIGLRIVIEKIAPPGAMYHKKTAEERFHMLARGWLAYPVTPMHAQLPPKSGCREMLRRGKTAEVRFNTLARGWLAYPVTPWHAQLPPKCGCRNTIATSASSRSDGTFP